jgi:PAS domain S-box-containing protein
MGAPFPARGPSRAALLGLFAAVLALFVNDTELLRSFELRTVDLRFRVRGPRQVRSPIAVVFAGDDSVEEYGRWPWNWEYHALLVDALQRAGARAVLFDVLFADSPSRGEEELLAAVLRGAGNVHLISSVTDLSPPAPGSKDRLLTGGRAIEPLPRLRAATAGVGHANAIRDADGSTRRLPVAVRLGGTLYPSAALSVAASVLDAPLEALQLTPAGEIEVRRAGRLPVRIPVDPEGMTPLTFPGGLDAFPVRFSYRQVLEADAHPRAAAIDLRELRDRIVVVGVSFTGNVDLQPTPFSTTYPMFLIQATLIDNILQGDFPHRPPAWVTLLLCLALGTATGVLTFSARPAASFAVASLAGSGYAASVVVAFTRGGWLLPLVPPLTASLAAYVLVTTVQYVEARRERQRALERLKYLGHLVESAVEAIFSFDPAGRIASWNGGAARVYGWSEAEALGRDWTFLLTPEARQPVEQALAILGTGAGGASMEVQLLGKDGRAIPVEIAFSSIRNSAGDVVGTSAISEDLTEKKRMLELLIQSEKLAEIGRMGSGIVHEIKNPLTSIMMMSDIIVATKDLPPKTIRYADIIQKESQRILRLSQNILSFARPRKPEMKATDVNAVLQDTLGLVEYELRKAKVEAVMKLDPSLAPAWGDGEKLKQVFLNLIVNASHAMAEGGRLDVGTFGPGVSLPAAEDGWPRAAAGEAPSGPAVRVRIADHGAGIPPEILERIFEPFFSTKGEGKGTGLGLYISRNIVLEHHGRIEVASAVGAGTVFTISLPVAPAGQKAPEAAASAAVEGGDGSPGGAGA